MSNAVPFPRKVSALTCYGFAGALLLTALLSGTHHLWSPIVRFAGFDALVLGGYLQHTPPAPAHTVLILVLGALFAAFVAYTLWSRLGAVALIPALALFLINGLIVLFARRIAEPS